MGNPIAFCPWLPEVEHRAMVTFIDSWKESGGRYSVSSTMRCRPLFMADSAAACNGNYFIDISEDSTFDSKLKRYRVSSPFVTAIGLMSCLVNRHTALAQKPIAAAFVVMTRISHAPGNLLQICSAIKYPTPRRRAPRTTKKSAISQTSGFPEKSEPFFTRAKPANLRSTVTRNGKRFDSVQ